MLCAMLTVVPDIVVAVLVALELLPRRAGSRMTKQSLATENQWRGWKWMERAQHIAAKLNTKI